MIEWDQMKMKVVFIDDKDEELEKRKKRKETKKWYYIRSDEI